MMSLSSFRANLFKTFELMRDTKVEIDVYHRRKVYRLTVKDMGERVTTPYRRSKASGGIPKAMINTKPCQVCDSLTVNGVCMNNNCPTNQKHGRKAA